MSQITNIIEAIEKGDTAAADQLMPLVYDELRRLAARQLMSESPNLMTHPTSLVHMAYVRLVGEGESGRQWKGSRHFYSAAADAMRHILVDDARRKRRPKHGGDRKRVPLEQVEEKFGLTNDSAIDILALDEALDRLSRDDPDSALLVKLRYFAGLTIDEAAEQMDISRATACRYWQFARAWLRKAMSDGEST